ncbi:restriction endonuclease subunit S, partial [Lactobacillus delbrueckii subsp. bulgaricus]
MTNNRLKHHLIDHDSDVIFTTHDDITDLAEVKYYHLFSGHFVALVPADHHLSDREELDLDDLAGEKILLMDNNWCPPEQLKLQETIRKKIDDLDISYVNDVEIVSLMVKAGLGITVMPSFVAIEKADEIKAVKLNYPAPLDYGLACRKDEAEQTPWSSPSARSCRNRRKGCNFAWEQCKLGDVAGIVGGGTPSTKKSEYWNGNINWFTPAEIGNQIFVSHSQKKITELGLLKSSAKILPAGTILFTSRAGIGNTAILTRNACTNQGFQSIVPYSNKLDSYFIYSESAKLKRYGETMGSGSTFTEVSGKQMKKMSLHIPNINEQAKIGNMLKILDRTITLHEEKKCLLERLKSALL